MRFWKRAFVALICIGLMVGVTSAALAVEMKLAGVKLGSAATDVLKKYGNPTRITIGSQPVGTVTTTVGPMLGLGASGGPLGPGGQNPAGYGYGTEPGASPTLPGLPGYGPPGSSYSGGYGTPGMSGGPVSPAQVQTVVSETQITWTYDWAEGITAEFLVSETGRIVQITLGGLQASKLSTTSKGIKLGATYKDMIFKYGYPESQSIAGRYLRLSYADKHRVVFTLLDKKLVGITIALKSE